MAAGAAAAVLALQGVALAGGTNKPPLIVPPPHGQNGPGQNLAGVPPNVRTLVQSFDETRDRYLQQQQLLLNQLKQASTPAERRQVRNQIQSNRSEFLNELNNYRQQLRDDIADLKTKVSSGEFDRVINAAHAGGGHQHKGH